MKGAPRGTKDLFGEELERRNILLERLVNWAKKQAFTQLESPTFEYSTLFTDSKSDRAEILGKELFFLKGEKYALKPEGTAPLARAVVSNKLIFNGLMPLKFFYITRCFRHERPQYQRLREFHQFGVEIINAHSLDYELELIYMLDTFFREELSLNLQLRVNYLSHSDNRKKWAEELKKYFRKNRESLSVESQEKIDSNPIRILDSEGSSQVVLEAPKISSFFSAKEQERILKLKKGLDELNIEYLWDTNLVRGLDYYTGVVFEWGYEGLGIAGGGRYDELFRGLDTGDSNLKNIPALGVAIGLERLQNILEKNQYFWGTKLDKRIYLCNLVDEIEPKILKLVKLLRGVGLEIESNWDLKELKAHFRRSERAGIKWLLIFGEKEREKNEIVLKKKHENFSLIFSLENEKGLIAELERLVDYGR